MNFAYTLRLVTLCLASFFIVQAVLGLIVRAIAPAAVRLAERMRPRAAASLLLFLRMGPAAAGLLAVCALCLPSYLLLEPRTSAEEVGLACTFAALLSVALWANSIARVLRAALASSRCASNWQRVGNQYRLPEGLPDILVVAEDTPVLALSGVFRPRLVASRGVLRQLSPDQLNAALRHECAHHAARDNFKRLLLFLAPDPIPFVRGFASLECAWSRFAEWAADDRAVAGDADLSLSLAEALVRVSRMGATPRLSPFLSTLTGNYESGNFRGSELQLRHKMLGSIGALAPEVGCLQVHSALLAPDDGDLSARVNRLLQPGRAPENSRRRIQLFAAGACVIAAGMLLTILLRPATFYAVHRLLEHLVH